MTRVIYVLLLIIEVYSLISLTFVYYNNPNHKIVKFRISPLIVSLFFIWGGVLQAQDAFAGLTFNEPNLLFQSETPLRVKWKYSNRDVKKQTNDTTYLDCMLAYQQEDGSWDSLEVKIRARGNWRQENCFLTPVKLRIKKSQRKGTIFKGNKELKMVLPCNNNKAGMDYVLKEYMAYKLYEEISPFHFKTRRVALDFTDDRGRKEKNYQLEAFFIEDTKEVADRCNAKRLRRNVHPLQQHDLACTQNDFFQFLIGNTDYSAAYQHNEKLLFVEGLKAIPVPYDFDMSGLVNTNYAVVSQVAGEQLPIDRVTDRLYRGYKRDDAVYEQVRQQYIDSEEDILARADALKPDFRDEKQFEEARKFLLEFFEIMEDPARYKRMVLDKAQVVKD